MYNINSEYRNFKFNKIKSGASKKIFYRLQKDNKSFILTDFNLDKKEYLNHLKIYNILKDLNISIPEIYEYNNTDLFTISEDFGNLRFDKIINNEPIDKLLFYAVDSLKIINHSLQFNSDFNLPIYNYKNFEDEIMELPRYFLPYFMHNIYYGLTKVKLVKFIIIIIISEIPLTYAFNSIGSSLNKISSDYSVSVYTLFTDINFYIPFLLIFMVFIITNYLNKKN